MWPWHTSPFSLADSIYVIQPPKVPPPAPGRSPRRASVLSQKFVNKVTPRSGRKKVAHGVSGGSASPSLTPRPLSRRPKALPEVSARPTGLWAAGRAGEGCRRRGEGSVSEGLPAGKQACALVPRTRDCAPNRAAEPTPKRDFVSELPTQDARSEANRRSAPRPHGRRSSTRVFGILSHSA